MTLRDRILAAQTAMGLNAQQMAAQLRITPEWLSKITNGRVRGSEDIGLRLDDLLRRAGVKLTSTGEIESGSTVHEEQSLYGITAEVLRREMRAHFDATIGRAGDNVSRLGYLNEILRAEFVPPAHWHTPGQEAPREESPAIREAKRLGEEGAFRDAAEYLEREKARGNPPTAKSG